MGFFGVLQPNADTKLAIPWTYHRPATPWQLRGPPESPCHVAHRESQAWHPQLSLSPIRAPPCPTDSDNCGSRKLGGQKPQLNFEQPWGRQRSLEEDAHTHTPSALLGQLGWPEASTDGPGAPILSRRPALWRRGREFCPLCPLGLFQQANFRKGHFRLLSALGSFGGAPNVKKKARGTVPISVGPSPQRHRLRHNKCLQVLPPCGHI